MLGHQSLALVVVVVLTILCGPPTAEAQPGRVPRIGFLGTTPSPYTEAMIQALNGLGYIHNRTADIDLRFSEGRPERFPELAAALVERKVDVLIVASEPATRAAKQATATIPIVMLLG